MRKRRRPVTVKTLRAKREAAGWVAWFMAVAILGGCGGGGDGGAAGSRPIRYNEPASFLSYPATSLNAGLGGPLNRQVVDINGDGLQDAIGHLFAQNQLRDHGVPTPIEILLNDGNGNVRDGRAELIAGSLPHALWVKNFLLEDFNNDGRLDIFMSNTGPEWGSIEDWPGEQNILLLSQTDGKLKDVSATHLPQIKDFSHGSAAADIDGDDDIDIWVNNGGPGELERVNAYLMLNDGTGRFTIVADIGNGTFYPFIGVNSRFPSELINSFGAYTSVFGDTDNDGDQDLVMWQIQYFNGTNDSRMVILLNDGTGHFTLSSPDALPVPPFNGSGAVDYWIAEDISEDGLVDFILGVVSHDGQGHFFQVLINNGDGTFADESSTRMPGQSTDTNGPEVPFHFLSDLDGDGDKDLLAAFFATLEFYENDGTGHFTRLPTAPFDRIRSDFYPMDVNSDGLIDFITACEFFVVPNELEKCLLTATR